jgi:hypothetical protein
MGIAQDVLLHFAHCLARQFIDGALRGGPEISSLSHRYVTDRRSRIHIDNQQLSSQEGK